MKKEMFVPMDVRPKETLNIMPICRKHFSEIYYDESGRIFCGKGGERMIGEKQIKWIAVKKHQPQ